MALAISLTVLPFAAHASAPDIPPARIEILYGNRSISSGSQQITIALDDELTLAYRVFPENADHTDVVWTSSRVSVASVDGYAGNITALRAGESIITARTQGRSGRAITAAVVAYVPQRGGTTGRVQNILREENEQPPPPLTANISPLPGDTVTLSGPVPREVLLNAVRLGDRGTPVVLRGYESVSPQSLNAAAGIGHFAVIFETMLGEVVVGRLTLRPEIADYTLEPISLGVYSKTENTARIQRIFDTFYTNTSVVILAEQDHFPVPVEISARVGSINRGNLHFYRYNPDRNNVARISVTDARVDSSNYIHFTTSTGGYIVVSDGPLTLRSS
ncbi:MAG: Ig-like domain-containing protein [Oscillospiraceae bacterium]|nr:Ig-like domain-containing protein [Oscillospiraceae bacterium]